MYYRVEGWAREHKTRVPIISEMPVIDVSFAVASAAHGSHAAGSSSTTAPVEITLRQIRRKRERCPRNETVVK